jgi:hypothetical protein
LVFAWFWYRGKFVAHSDVTAHRCPRKSIRLFYKIIIDLYKSQKKIELLNQLNAMEPITMALIYGLTRGIPYLINKWESKSETTPSISTSELENTGILAIDFGTSRIKAAYWDKEKSEALVLPLGKDGRLYVPSLFYINNDGVSQFGDDADMMLHHDPQGVVENLKLGLDKPIKYVPNGQKVKSGELVSLLFGRIIGFASTQIPSFCGNEPKTLVLTLPSRWDYGDIYMDALETIGYKGEKIVIREPEAAGLAWIKEEKPPVGDMLVVLDFGGGTIDWACLRVDENGHSVMIPELPPGGVTAAGSHVDAGLFDEMMMQLTQEQRIDVQQHRAQVLEQIRRMKESQNGQASLSRKDGVLEVALRTGSFVFPKKVFDEVVKHEAVDQAVEGIGGYVKKVVRHVTANNSKKQIWCLLTGGTRLLVGVEDRVKERVMEIGKAGGVDVKIAKVGQADFATVRGAVLKGVPAIGSKTC